MPLLRKKLGWSDRNHIWRVRASQGCRCCGMPATRVDSEPVLASDRPFEGELAEACAPSHYNIALTENNGVRAKKGLGFCGHAFPLCLFMHGTGCGINLIKLIPHPVPCINRHSGNACPQNPKPFFALTPLFSVKAML